MNRLLLNTASCPKSSDDLHPVNLGLSATNVAELEFVLDYALRSCDPSLVVLEASLLAFGGVRSTSGDFEQSPFNPHLETMEFRLRSVFSGTALHQSLDVISRFARAEASAIDSRGFNAKPMETTSREAARRVLAKFFTNPEAYHHFDLSPDRLARFERMLRKIHARKVAAVVFIPPVHAIQLEAIRVAGLWTSFERWKASLASISERTGTPIYDFADYSPILAEPISESQLSEMIWFFECSHFRPALGEKVLARILLDRPDPELPGTRLTTGSLTEHLAATRARRELYAASNPAEIEWVENVHRVAMATKQRRD